MCANYVEIMWPGRIGLGWAHDVFLLLHVTCSCIFHAYVPFFSILLILICCWYFSICLSLSLSIWLVCSVAPKKSNSTPSWNPLHSGTSTSDSTPSHIRFRDEKSRQDFSENFSRWGICSEHIGLGWAHDVYIVACHVFMHFLCICTFFLYWSVLVLFYLSLSLSLSLSVSLLYGTQKEQVYSVLKPSILRHLLLILPPLTFGFVMRKPVRTS